MSAEKNTRYEDYQQLMEMLRGYLDGVAPARKLRRFCVPIILDRKETVRVWGNHPLYDLLDYVERMFGVWVALDDYAMDEERRKLFLRDMDCDLRVFIGYHIPTSEDPK